MKARQRAVLAGLALGVAAGTVKSVLTGRVFFGAAMTLVIVASVAVAYGVPELRWWLIYRQAAKNRRRR